MNRVSKAKMKVVLFYEVVVRTPDGDNVVVGKFENQLQAVLTKAKYTTAFVVATYSDGEVVIM